MLSRFCVDSIERRDRRRFRCGAPGIAELHVGGGDGHSFAVDFGVVNDDSAPADPPSARCVIPWPMNNDPGPYHGRHRLLRRCRVPPSYQ